MAEAANYDFDDRGNVVDFYYGDDFVARLDREAGDNAALLAWDGDGSVEKFARLSGYGKQIDEAKRNAKLGLV